MSVKLPLENLSLVIHLCDEVYGCPGLLQVSVV